MSDVQKAVLRTDEIDCSTPSAQRGTPSARPQLFSADTGNELRAARVSAGLSLSQFATRLAVSVACVSRWETDVRRPHSADIARIGAVLNRPSSVVQDWFASPALSTEALRHAHGLRVLRHRAGLSRAHLAAAAGVSAATVAHWECGRRALPLARFPTLANALGLAVEDFLVAVHAGAPSPPPGALVRMRRRRGLTQRQVAARLGVSGSLVSRWERGQCVPSWPHTRRLAMLLQVPLATVSRAVGRSAPVRLDRSTWHDGALGPVLREVRVWRGESRAALSTKVGVHPQTMQRWEAGATRPTARQLLLLEAVLGLPVASLPR